MSKINKVRKAVIPAAGMGTRFLPVTKAMPKEMLPILNVPTIQYIVEEAIKSGIEEILIVVSSTKNSIMDHFDYSYELENRLKEKNKMEEFREIRKIADMAKIHFIRQKEPNGLGHAILCAQSFIGDEPFAVLLGDDVVFNEKNEKPALQQCLDVFNKTKSSVVGVQKVPKEKVKSYGIIQLENPKDAEEKNVFKVKDLVEKPSIERSPSQFAILGRYVLTPEIFAEISKTREDKSGEIQLTNAIRSLSKTQSIYACEFSGKRYDMGSLAGFVFATIDTALKNKNISQDVWEHLIQILKTKKIGY